MYKGFADLGCGSCQVFEMKAKEWDFFRCFVSY